LKPHLTAFVLLTMSAASPTFAAETGCPMGPGKILMQAEVYDGPVDDNAMLAPDSSSGTASKGKNRFDVGGVYAQGRHVVVGCHYKGEAKPVFVEIKTKVKTCEQSFDPKAGGSLTCR
jgi:hypothetical protein